MTGHFPVRRTAAAFVICSLAVGVATAPAQGFSGTNQPGAGQNFVFSTGAGATNLALTVPGSATVFSHLLLRAGVAPTDTAYDFLAALNGQTNAINLELPELKPTNYVLRVRTPSNSLVHSFTVTLVTNVADLRATNRPATKPLVSTNAGSLTAGAWHFFRVEIATNLPGWRVILSSSNAGPDLYVQRDQLPTTSSSLRKSLSQTNDVLAFAPNELTPGAYFIGVQQPSGSGSYTLRTEIVNFTTLAWDPGATHAGTQVYTNAGTNGGDFYFRITTQNPALDAWRTALNVAAGDANIYLSKGFPPSAGSNAFKSDRVGSDGFVLGGASFDPGEDWYYLVHAEPGAQWTLVSGEPFVTDLGTVAADGSSGSGNLAMGAEGMRFFKTTVPVSAVAWRLWLNGLTNSILVKKTSAPVPGGADLTQPGQMLVVPTYLVGGQLFFVGVSGAPGGVINLDSRLQLFADIPFASATNTTVTGFGYTTYRVQVPVDQIAWQVSVVVSNGNPNVGVRRSFVPNEANNDAYSEVAGSVTDSLLLVPPTLTDGTFFITVYGTNAHTFTLQNGTPEVTPINFTGATTNTDTNRVGWRLFQLSDIGQQLGALGWDLFITNFAPGTRLALRRNAAPGIWNFRNPTAGTAGVYDYLSTADFLQRPGHPADVWYVGVYNPTSALGNFTLVTRELTADPLAADGGLASRAGVPAGKWQFFRVDVPTNALGWDVRLTNVTSGLPQLLVRRELLPVSLSGIGFSGTITATNWPSGNQWAAGTDWTGRNLSPDGTVNESGRILTMGYNRPLEAGTYYLGVLNAAGSTNAMSYTVQSRLIGPTFAIPVNDLGYTGGMASASLAARGVAAYRVVIPSNAPSWKVKLTATTGDVSLAVAKNHIPNITAVNNGSVTNTQTAGRKMLKPGNEHFVLLPDAGETNLFSGVYYLLVASDGLVDLAQPTRIGAGGASCTLQSIGPMPDIDLGLLDTGDILHTNSLEGGESLALHFHNLPETLGFELKLEERTGNPVIVSRGELDLADPGAASTIGTVAVDPYGNEGGQGDFLQASPYLITVVDPFLAETLMVKARSAGGVHTNATFTLRIRKLVPTPMAFDGGLPGGGHCDTTNFYEFFQVVVPPDALGWDCRLVNVSNGAPQLIVSRDFLPVNLPTPGWNPGSASFWPSGARWFADKDWTQRSNSADGAEDEDGRILAMGMGRPLEPGTYYIGVYNPDAPERASCQVVSRGIGGGYSIPVVDLPFAGGNATSSAVPPREAAYYRVVIPTNATSWQAKLTAASGDALLLALSNSLPSVLTGRAGAVGKAMQKAGNEHYLLLPVSPQTGLQAGTHYLAVANEGMVATNQPTRIGTNSSSFLIESRGTLPVIDLGAVGTTDLVHTATLEGGEVRAYQFTVPPGVSSVEARLQSPTGNPTMVLRIGSLFPNPGAPSPTSGAGSVANDDYGNEGGYTVTSANGNANTNLITLANPTNGVYTIMVKARGPSGAFANAGYTLVVRTISYTDVAFDGGCVVVTNHPANTWRYYQIEVPTNALGWDLRLANVISGAPKLVVRRDLLPNALTTTPWGTPSIVTNWPTTNQWAAGSDWTRRTTSADGLVNEDGRILAMGMGQPLEPGTYYVGVINSAGTNAMSYSLCSRGIGAGFSLSVTDLAFSGGSATNAGLLPRETAYYRVVVPTNVPGWRVKLTCTSGEAMLLALKDHVPSVDCGRFSSAIAGKFVQKAGNEHYVLLPGGSATNLVAGTYYLAVAGEGLNPALATRIGTDSSSYVLTSLGSLVVSNLGNVGPADLVRSDALAGGESRFYNFNVPSNTLAVELRLENRVGNPMMVLVTNASLPDPGGVLSGAKDLYGNDGGVNPHDATTNIITVANPTNGLFTVAVKARANAGGAYPDASYTLRVRQIPVPDLNFTPEFNTNGLSNVTGGLLLDNQRAYFRVAVPTNVHGRPVIGWELNLSELSGYASFRVRRDFLPSDTLSSGMPFTANSAVIAPPFLTNGTWYVEVRGSNSTSFTLVSSNLALLRPAWTMPGVGEPSTTPGLTAPDFGDSGLETNGVPLPGDQGVDLEQGRYHFYAVLVPTNNGGLLRVQLDAISGNSDVYLRVGNVPTFSHRTNGASGPSLDRSLTGTVTEYGNFVPLNGQTEARLTNGIWYLAVRAVTNANARYRLRLSTGAVQDLDAFGGSAINQSLAAGDWGYFRVQIPADAPPGWQVTFAQQSGDVVVHVRDTIPPGNGATIGSSDYKDWASDLKNSGPYANYDSPGAYTFNAPPVRPGTAYYLGFRAKNDATFSVSSTMAGATNPLPPVIAFYGGSVTNSISPGSQVAYRILTPADGLRWRHTSVHSNSVGVYIENGTYPTKTSSDDFRSTSANSSQDRFLTAYPWLPNQTYYLLATNTSGLTQYFSFSMNGSSTNADDDADGMLDAWEVQYFATIAQLPNGDYDADGVSNLSEFNEGTNPTDKNSLRPRLTVIGTNGVVGVNPASSNYVLGATVTLTATPNAGYNFVGWTGAATGAANPLVVTMTSNKTIVARFRVPADDFDQRVTLAGPFAASGFYTNAGASKEIGEPNHAGNPGGKSLWWTWTAPFTRTVTLNTAGSDFRNALAVYTGSSVSSLTAVASHLAGAGTNTSQVTFTAVAGTTYQIAVDGYNGASGRVMLNLAMPGLLVLADPVALGPGQFRFNVLCATGQVVRIEATVDFMNWTPVATATNLTGTIEFTDPAAGGFNLRFYRGVIGNFVAPQLLMLSAPAPSGGQFIFTILGATGQTVRVETGTNLVNWTTLATFTNASGPVPFADPAASNFSRRFYRAVSP